jgi:hypothetical protein
MREPVPLIGCLLTAHRTGDSLEALRKQAARGEGDLTLLNGPLLYKNGLVVPVSDHLIKDLIQEAQIKFPPLTHDNPNISAKVLLEAVSYRCC